MFNVLLQMLYVWHWAECLQEAGAGIGNSVQRNSRILGRWREAAAKGSLAQLSLPQDISMLLIILHIWPVRKSSLKDARGFIHGSERGWFDVIYI